MPTRAPLKPKRKRRRSLYYGPAGLGLDVFTTGQVARILRLYPRVICKLIDRGDLDGFYVPGSRDRRVTRASLIRFAEWVGYDWLATVLSKRDETGTGAKS